MRAETTRVCDAGLSAYLADKHSEFRLRSFSRGVVSGAILTLPTYFLVQSTGINPIFSILPLASGLLSGTWTGLTQADRNDALNTADFVMNLKRMIQTQKSRSRMFDESTCP